MLLLACISYRNIQNLLLIVRKWGSRIGRVAPSPIKNCGCSDPDFAPAEGEGVIQRRTKSLAIKRPLSPSIISRIYVSFCGVAAVLLEGAPHRRHKLAFGVFRCVLGLDSMAGMIHCQSRNVVDEIQGYNVRYVGVCVSLHGIGPIFLYDCVRPNSSARIFADRLFPSLRIVIRNQKNNKAIPAAWITSHVIFIIKIPSARRSKSGSIFFISKRNTEEDINWPKYTLKDCIYNLFL